MDIKDVMHKGVEWVSPDTPVSEIAGLMKAEDIGAVPVREDGRLVGIVTDRDLVLRALPGDADPKALKARDVMTKDIVYCRSDQSIEDAVHLMEDRQIRRLPVISDEHRVVGMLSLADISHRVSRELSGELVRAVASPHPIRQATTSIRRND